MQKEIYIHFYNVLQQTPHVGSLSHITSRFHRLFVMIYLMTLLALRPQSTQSR